jgi:hypothetical protein
MNPAKSSVRLAEAGDLHELACLRETLWPESTASEHAQELALVLAGKPPTTMPLVIFVSEVSGRIAERLPRSRPPLLRRRLRPNSPGWLRRRLVRRRITPSEWRGRRPPPHSRRMGPRTRLPRNRLRHSRLQHSLPTCPRVLRLPGRRTRRPLSQDPVNHLSPSSASARSLELKRQRWGPRLKDCQAPKSQPIRNLYHVI